MNNSNPFNRWKKDFSMATRGSLDFTKAAIGTSQEVQKQRTEEKYYEGTVIRDLPRHLFTPEGARSLDMRNLAIVPAGTVGATLLSFTAPEGTACFFTGYAIFNDGLAFSLLEFLPLIDEKRIFPYHGDPNSNFKIALGLGPDLGNESIIDCQLQLEPGQTLKWLVTNNDVVDVTMGVRMKGYIDSRTSRPTRVFGG